MWAQLLSFLMLVGCYNASLAKEKSCKTLLGELGDSQSHFVYCATDHSVPVALCVACKNLYTTMSNSYDALMSIENCSKTYLNTDRINIVSTTQGVLTNIWQKANCDDCFNGNHSTNYDALWTEFDTCLGQHPKSECTHCKLQYVKLNSFYLQMDKANKGHVCFDLQDSMNRTRLKWSDELKCCQREVKMTLFLVTVALVVVLPLIIFYSTSVILTKRREADHGVINHETPELEDPAPSTSALITAAVLTTPSEALVEIEARNEQIAKVLNHSQHNSYSESSSDEEPILQRSETVRKKAT